MVVKHNLTAMNSNRMLGLTTTAQAKSTERLSSGYKINRAADDASGLSISEKMRKQIRGLTQASANAQDGISAVQTAEGALNEVHDMLQRMNELAVKAANETMSESDRQDVQREMDALVTEIDRVSETTKFNETYLLKGDSNGKVSKDYSYKPADVLKDTLYYVKGTEVKTIEKGTLFSALDTSLTYFSSNAGQQVGEAYTEVAAFTTQKAVTSTDYYMADANGDFYLVAAGAEYNNAVTYYTVEFTTNGSISSASQTDALTATGYFASKDVYDKNGNKISNDTYLGTTFTATYYSSIGKGILSSNDAVTLADYKTSDSIQLTDADGNEIAANGLYAYFSEDGKYSGSGLYLKVGDSLKIATQEDINEMIDVGTKDTGVLNLSLHVGADATSNNQISLKIEAMSAKSIGIEGISVSGKDGTNALNAIETISAALKQVSQQRSTLGATQNRLEHTISNLDNIVENTTSAESAIRDTDMATEMVKYSNNSILAQAGQSMLAQANQSNQGVLSLLG